MITPVITSAPVLIIPSPPKVNVNINIQPDILNYLECVANESGYELSLLQGLIQLECEGTWDPNFIDGRDYGLCQINKSNHAWLRKVFKDKYTEFNVLDYRQNIDSAVFILTIFKADLRSRLKRDPTLEETLTAYNKGPNYVTKHGVYRPYVNVIFKHQKEYQKWNEWRDKYEKW